MDEVKEETILRMYISFHRKCIISIIYPVNTRHPIELNNIITSASGATVIRSCRPLRPYITSNILARNILQYMSLFVIFPFQLAEHTDSTK